MDNNNATTHPSIYVGETCRSIQERAIEHQDAYKKEKEDSHMTKHWALHHQGEEKPKFIFKIVKFYQTALSRQVGEAVRIAKRGRDGGVLNSKGEFNRCKIVRLSLGEVGTDESSTSKEPEEWEEIDYTISMLRQRDERDKANRVALGKPTKTSG